MDERASKIESIYEVFRERVSTEGGLGWVAHPKVRNIPGGGVLFEFFATGGNPRFASIEFSAPELENNSDIELKRFAGEKWLKWRSEYDAERTHSSRFRSRRSPLRSRRMGNRRYQRR